MIGFTDEPKQRYFKVLFLDVDGVLNSEETFKKDPNAEFPIDPYMAFLVGRIQLETDCKVVLSSSWRHHRPSVVYIHTRIVELYDQTQDLSSTRLIRLARGEEIKHWIENSKYKVDKYAILDDDDDMLQEQKPNFFHTSWKNGLTDDIANKVIEHLNEKSPD